MSDERREDDPQLAAMFRKVREDIERTAAYNKADTNSKISASAAFAWLFAFVVFGILHSLHVNGWVWWIWAIFPAVGWLSSAKKHLDTMNENADPES